MAKAKYVVTSAAQADIREIIAYIRERNPRAAKAVRLRLYADIRRLGDFPHIGHVRDDIDLAAVRYWPCYSYLIVYLPDPSPIQIIRVLHGARDLPTLLGP